MRYYLLSILFTLTIEVAKGQDIDSDKASDLNVTKAFGPTVGVGIGTIAFYGDLNDRNYGSPFSSNIGYNLYLLQPISKSFNVKFGFFLGKVRNTIILVH